MMRYPIMLLADLKSATSIPNDLYRRYEKYGTEIKQQSQGLAQGLFLISGGHNNKISHQVDKHLWHFAHQAKRWQYRKAARYAAAELVNRDVQPPMVIAGDPFFGLLAAFRLRKLLKRNIPIQVSFHGELTKIGFGTSIKGRLQNIFVKLTIKKVDSVRLVSEDQIEYALSLFGIDRSKIVIAPVPITSTITWADRPNRKVIGFVGRIHPQRGVGTWVETLSKITFPCEALIIGDGSLRIEMVEKLRLLSHINAKFTGYLAQSEVDEKWNSISVLLSTAPYESYGMAMREAILHGVPVVSIRNSGSQKLFDQCPEMITLVSNSSEAAHAVEHFINNPPPQSASDKFRKDFLAQQKRNLEILAQSWIGNLLA